jgi:nitrogen fixation protein
MAWLAGCASVTITPVTKDDRKTPGVRYYESEPYLLIAKDAIQLVWLPNYNMGYAVQTKPGLGKADGSVKLADGWRMTEFGAMVDTKIPETISAVADLVKASGVSALTKGAPAKTAALELGLYRLKFNKDKGCFEGVERVF